MASGRKQHTRSELEAAILDAFPFLIDALGISALGLLVPASLSLRWRMAVQLLLISAFGAYLAYRLIKRLEPVWFDSSSLTSRQRAFGTALGLVIIVTGSVGLVTLASSAALRLRPSTQFLQLLSALDIAWAGSTVMFAAYWLWNRVRLAVLLAILVLVMCMWALIRYIDEAALGRGGGWQLRASELWEFVLPYDIVIAVIAIGMLFLAVRRRAASL